MRIHESVGAANERRYLRGGFVKRQHSLWFAEFRTPRTLKRLASLVVAYVCLHPDLARVRASSRVRGVQNSATPTTCSYTPHICVCVCVCVCVRYVRRHAFICVGGEGKRGLGVAGLEAAPIICAEGCVEGSRSSTPRDPLQKLG